MSTPSPTEAIRKCGTLTVFVTHVYHLGIYSHTLGSYNKEGLVLEYARGVRAYIEGGGFEIVITREILDLPPPPTLLDDVQVWEGGDSDG